MARAAFLRRAAGDRMTVAVALKRYLADVVPTKRPSSQTTDKRRSMTLIKHLGKYSLASLTPEIIVLRSNDPHVKSRPVAAERKRTPVRENDPPPNSLQRTLTVPNVRIIYSHKRTPRR
jgi:hypothetical protein